MRECQERGEAVGDAGKRGVEEMRKMGVGDWLWYQEYFPSSRVRNYNVNKCFHSRRVS